MLSDDRPTDPAWLPIFSKKEHFMGNAFGMIPGLETDEWSNDACRGYVIMAMEDCGFSKKDIRRVVGQLYDFIDVDNFKDYNDKYGHANGDLCLKHFAAAMKKCFPKDSILGRYGGDEFVVYIKNAASDDAHRYMDEFQREISHLIMSGGEHVTVSASAGGVAFIGGGEDFVSLCRSADNMLYDVKRNGKGTFKIKGAKNM